MLMKLLLLVTALTLGWEAGLWAIAHGWISHEAASGGSGIVLIVACALGGLALGGLMLFGFDYGPFARLARRRVAAGVRALFSL